MTPTKIDRARIAAYVDGELTPEEAAAVAMHLLKLTLGTAPDHAVLALRDFLKSRKNEVNQETILGCLLLITAMPEYQLC